MHVDTTTTSSTDPLAGTDQGEGIDAPDLRVFIDVSADVEPQIRQVRLQAASPTGQALLAALT